MPACFKFLALVRTRRQLSDMRMGALRSKPLMRVSFVNATLLFINIKSLRGFATVARRI